MTYNPDNYAQPTPGARETVKIANIVEGTQGGFRSETYFEKLEPEEKKDAMATPAIKVICSNGAEAIIPLPKNPKNVGAKTLFSAFRKTYGAFPTIGQEIIVRVNDKAFWEIVLEK